MNRRRGAACPSDRSAIVCPILALWPIPIGPARLWPRLWVLGVGTVTGRGWGGALVAAALGSAMVSRKAPPPTFWPLGTDSRRVSPTDKRSIDPKNQYANLVSPAGFRTHGPKIRNLVLYPAELRRHLVTIAEIWPARSPELAALRATFGRTRQVHETMRRRGARAKPVGPSVTTRFHRSSQ